MSDCGMDSTIAKEFDRCVEEGLLRSDVEGLRMKWVSGSKHFIAQYHPTWQIVKRKPYFQHPSMKEPFSQEAFNFTKVRENECLAKYVVSNGKVIFIPRNVSSSPSLSTFENATSSTESIRDTDTVYTILLNVSPICHNHHLIIPNLEQCHNQVWDDRYTIDLIDMSMNSERSDYVLFFNSLGGFSSVNHLHYQVMYTSSFYATATSHPDPPLSASFSPSKLPVEFATSEFLRKVGSIEISSITDWLCQTVKLRFMGDGEYERRDREVMAALTNIVIDMCYVKEIPYDVILTNNGKEVYVFVRKYQQSLDDLRVNPACVELTGIVVYRSEETFNQANEETLMKRCKEVVHLEEATWKEYLNSLVTRLDNEQIYFCFFDSLLSQTRDFFAFFCCCFSSSLSACF